MTREESNASLDLFPSESTIIRRERRRRIVALAHTYARSSIRGCRVGLVLLQRFGVGLASRAAPYVASARASVSSRLRPLSQPRVSRRGWAVTALTMAAFGSGLLVGASTRSAANVDGSRLTTTPRPAADVALRGVDLTNHDREVKSVVPSSRIVPRSAMPPAPPAAVLRVAPKPPLAAEPRLAAKTTPVRATKPRAPTFSGSLVVNSRPAGARVFLNGRNAGTTPLVLKNQAAGSRAVRVALDGYRAWSSVVQIVTGTETRLQATLLADPAH